MSASARRRENQRRANVAGYPAAVWAALESDDESLVDFTVCRVLGCPVCGNLILGTCGHDVDRLARRLGAGS